jgi:diacylglycerol kinase family enzyme
MLEGQHGKYPEVTMYRTNELRVESDEGLIIHADGEIIGNGARHVKVEVLKQQLTVIRH